MSLPVDSSCSKWVGIQFLSLRAIDEFFVITGPCGTVVKYPLNNIPTVDVPCPCGNPNHWIIRYSSDPPEGSASLAVPEFKPQISRVNVDVI